MSGFNLGALCKKILGKWANVKEKRNMYNNSQYMKGELFQVFFSFFFGTTVAPSFGTQERAPQTHENKTHTIKKAGRVCGKRWCTEGSHIKTTT